MKIDMNELRDKVQEEISEETKNGESTDSNVPNTDAVKPTEQPKPENALPTHYSQKSISDITMHDIQVQLDGNKTFEEQAEDVARMGAVVKAVEDEDVRTAMARSKGEQLVERGKTKATEARANRIQAETQEQKNKSDLYQAVLETFGIFKHFPDWLMRMIVVLLTPIYLIFLVVIGIPIGAVHFAIDCLDGLFIRYDKVDKDRKPKVKVIGWVVLALGIVCAITFPLLKHFNII